MSVSHATSVHRRAGPLSADIALLSRPLYPSLNARRDATRRSLPRV
jgi:hypothetical protein